MSYHKPYNYLHSDEVYIALRCEDKEGLEYFPIGDAQRIRWRYRWTAEPYYAIGDDMFPSEIFRDKFVAEGELEKLVLKKHRDVRQDLIDLGAMLILGEIKHPRFPSITFPYSSVNLVFYAISLNEGYEFSRIIITDVDGGIDEGEFAREKISFIASRVEKVSL